MKKNILRSITGILTLMAGHTAWAQCPTITCPADITVSNDPGTCGAVVNYTTPTGSNPCGLTTFGYTGTIDTWTVPAGVTVIHIEARGAQGGWNTSSTYQPGLGAYMSGDFNVTPGQQLRILVGQQPSNGSGNGGGGGTFVTDISNNPLIIAGGGGGSSQSTDSPDKHGQIGTTGGTGAAGGGTGGSAGNGGGIGASGFQSGAGGGLLTDGANGWTTGTGGQAFVNGGAGGPNNAPANGGFGGGGSGSSYVVGGGGGGYSGGGSGGNSTAGVGGGGGSYNAGTNQNNTGGVNTGHGSVTIGYGAGSGVTITLTGGLASGSVFPVGINTVTYEAEDGLGNTVNCSFTVTVNDTTTPVPDMASLPALSGCSVTVSSMPTATDNCGGTITGTTTDPLTYNVVGTYAINWTYDDGNGNSSVQTQQVNVTSLDTMVSVTGATLTANLGGATYAWLNCTSGTMVGGETGQTFSPLVNGSYALVVTDNGCTDTSSCHTINSVGINVANEVSGINVYPNPTTGLLNLELNNIDAAQVRVSNVFGQLVFSGNVTRNQSAINLSAFGAGVYYIDVRTATGNKVMRVVKQ